MEGSGPRLSDEGHKVYRVRQTCMKMLEKRGYNVLQEHVSMSSEAFLQIYGAEPKRHDLTLLVEKVRGIYLRSACVCSQALLVYAGVQTISTGVPGMHWLSPPRRFPNLNGTI